MTVTNNDESLALDLKYRPRNLDQVIGHTQEVQLLKGMVATGKIPNALIFLGPTSAGKTTLAQAFAASASNLTTIAQQQDFASFNAGDQRSIDDVRNWAKIAAYNPNRLPRRWILIDEAQGVLSNPAAATALLVPLENPSRRTTWLLTSMEPEKFATSTTGKAILGRCTKIKLSAPSVKDLCLQADRILKGEGARADFPKETVVKIAQNAQGQMRELAKVVQSVLSWNAGRGGGEVTPEDVAKLLVTMEVNDDEMDDLVWQWLFCLYAGFVDKAVRIVLNVTDVVPFLIRATQINRAVVLDLANKGQQHPKIWHNRASRSLLERVQSGKSPTPLSIARGVAIHKDVSVAKLSVFDIDGLLSLTHTLTAGHSASTTERSH